MGAPFFLLLPFAGQDYGAPVTRDHFIPQSCSQPVLRSLRFLAVLCLCCHAGLAPGQGTQADYARARSLESLWKDKTAAFRPVIRWDVPGGGIAYAWTSAPGVTQYVRVDLDGKTSKAKDPASLGLPPMGAVLKPQSQRRSSSNGGDPARILFENKLDQAIRLKWVDDSGKRKDYGELLPGKSRDMGTYVGHVWVAETESGHPVGIFIAEPGEGKAVVDATSSSEANPPPSSEPPNPVHIKNHNLWLRNPAGSETALTTNGHSKDPYRPPIHLSASRKQALAFQIEPGEEHLVYFVESSPKDRVQPKWHQHAYTKPGDRIDNPRPRLIDLEQRRIIPVEESPFTNAWSIDEVHWSQDGKEVFCLHNARGHQTLKILGIRVDTGAVRTVLEEHSDTFVDYSQKTVLQWIEGQDAFLWASERDGWNHLYWGDAANGTLRQITRGNWVFRQVDHVDPVKKEIWFTAYGIHPGQDPYYAHLARVGFDGKGLTLLTQGDGTHTWTFSPDRSLFVDKWSRVDQPMVTELRRASDGSLVVEMGRDDVSRLLEAGYRPPQRFVAKGRDGKTDIYGIVILPSNFDPKKKYPVVEDIYAGPHDHFVPKRWGMGYRQRMIAELGFIVVQIDGMGTNWRDRAFHDVCWRNLKDSGFPDRIAWIKAAAATYPQMDLSRVGIFGGSAGGQSALAALLHHGEFYKAAVADCGCHDNRMDKIWWNEAWMGYPVGPWYAESSNVTHAKKLTGKLMLTVGEMDRNVDPASTMQVAAALIAADKDFDFVVIPGGGHGVGETPYLVRRRMDFFVRHLLGVEPRLP